jgi:hypothetical protein
MTEFQRIRQKILFEYFDKFPNAGNLTLAKKIYSENPDFFKNAEHAREVIRYYRGVKGKENYSHLKDKKYVRKPV